MSKDLSHQGEFDEVVLNNNIKLRNVSENITNIEEIKAVAKSLFLAVPIIENPNFPGLVQHPFTSTNIFVNPEGQIIYLTTKEGFEYYKNLVFKLIDKAKSIADIWVLLGSAWYLTFLQYASEYMSKEDFSTYLGDAWTEQEFPNRDCNVKRRTLISWFKIADNVHLMSNSLELHKFNYIREEIMSKGFIYVYRGISSGGKPNGLSWTLDINKAIWFANRWGKGKESNPKVYRLKITDLKCVLAFFNRRFEQEVIIDTSIAKDWEEVDYE